MTAPWYQRLFPRTRISRSKNTELERLTTRNGYRLATSVDGTTGRGGNILIIDDPLKPIDALSDSRRENVNDWFANTLMSRLDDTVNGAIMVAMQRLHMDDLVGRLLRNSPNEWTVLTLPAIAEQDEKIQISADRYHLRHTGDLLHPEREPRSLLKSIRSQLGSEMVAAQYQQAPVPPDGCYDQAGVGSPL